MASTQEMYAEGEGKERSRSTVLTNSPSANPGPIGLIAFGMTTVFSMMITVGAVSKASKSLLLCHALFHGGLLQLIAGMWEFKRGNIFGATAFSSYGMFWIIDVSIGYTNPLPATDGKCLWLALWALFTLMMGLATLKTNRVLQFVFFTLFVTFVFLSAGVYSHAVERVAGGVGIVCGLSAMYLGWAELVNELYSPKKVPIWPVSNPFEQD